MCDDGHGGGDDEDNNSPGLKLRQPCFSFQINPRVSFAASYLFSRKRSVIDDIWQKNRALPVLIQIGFKQSGWRIVKNGVV